MEEDWGEVVYNGAADETEPEDSYQLTVQERSRLRMYAIATYRQRIVLSLSRQVAAKTRRQFHRKINP